jgi:hypothetical protein
VSPFYACHFRLLGDYLTIEGLPGVGDLSCLICEHALSESAFAKSINSRSVPPAAVAAYEFSRWFMAFEKIMRPGATIGAFISQRPSTHSEIQGAANAAWSEE